MVNNDDGKTTVRYDTAENWQNANPVLAKGECIVEVGADGIMRMKCGDGTTDYNSLAYMGCKQADNSTNSLSLNGGTMKGAITTNFGGFIPTVYQAKATSVNALINEVRYMNGAMGSVNISTATSPVNPAWYNFIYIPHRAGGNGNGGASGDNTNYGTLLLFFMTSNTSTWYTVHLSNGTIYAPQAHA